MINERGTRRIQLSRRKEWKLPTGACRVDAHTRWANPFPPNGRSRRAYSEAVAQFADWLTQQHELVARARLQLVDVDLACWCPPNFDCHADVWLKVVNEPPEAFPMAPMAPAAPYAVSVADLPAHRRRRVLFGLSSGSRCDLWDWQSCTPPDHAQLADDGRFHLIGDSSTFDCASHAEPGTLLQHSYSPSQWDGRRLAPRVAPPTDAERENHSMTRTLMWLDQTRTDTSLVPSRERCPPAAEHWPGYTGTAHRDVNAQTRRLLVRQLGPMCHSCGLRRACRIDHDHDTGLVRGYVCIHCNSKMDTCLHLEGCPWADYLNNPPAFAMKLPYRGTTTALKPVSDTELAEREAALNAVLARLTHR